MPFISVIDTCVLFSLNIKAEGDILQRPKVTVHHGMEDQLFFSSDCISIINMWFELISQKHQSASARNLIYLCIVNA